MQQLVAPQPQAQAQELTAGHIAGGSANKIHASQQDRNTGSSSQAHTQYILHCSVYYDTGWFLFGLFPSCQKGFFPGNLKGYRVPKFNISLVGPSHYYPFVITILILSAYTEWPSWEFYLGVIPVGYPKRPILGVSTPKQSQPMQPWEAPC